MGTHSAPRSSLGRLGGHLSDDSFKKPALLSRPRLTRGPISAADSKSERDFSQLSLVQSAQKKHLSIPPKNKLEQLRANTRWRCLPRRRRAGKRKLLSRLHRRPPNAKSSSRETSAGNHSLTALARARRRPPTRFTPSLPGLDAGFLGDLISAIRNRSANTFRNSGLLSFSLNEFYCHCS